MADKGGGNGKGKTKGKGKGKLTGTGPSGRTLGSAGPGPANGTRSAMIRRPRPGPMTRHHVEEYTEIDPLSWTQQRAHERAIQNQGHAQWVQQGLSTERATRQKINASDDFLGQQIANVSESLADHHIGFNEDLDEHTQNFTRHHNRQKEEASRAHTMSKKIMRDSQAKRRAMNAATQAKLDKDREERGMLDKLEEQRRQRDHERDMRGYAAQARSHNSQAEQFRTISGNLERANREREAAWEIEQMRAEQEPQRSHPYEGYSTATMALLEGINNERRHIQSRMASAADYDPLAAQAPPAYAARPPQRMITESTAPTPYPWERAPQSRAHATGPRRTARPPPQAQARPDEQDIDEMVQRLADMGYTVQASEAGPSRPSGPARNMSRMESEDEYEVEEAEE